MTRQYEKKLLKMVMELMESKCLECGERLEAHSIGQIGLHLTSVYVKEFDRLRSVDTRET